MTATSSERGQVHMPVLPHQAQTLQATETNLGLFGGFGSGKSFTLILASLDFSRRYPGVAHGVGGPTYVQLKKDIIAPTREVLRQWGAWDYENKTDHHIRPAWCTEEDAGLWFQSGEEPDAIKGANWGTLCLNEPGLLTREAYEVFVSRLRVPLLVCMGCGKWRADWRNIVARASKRPGLLTARATFKTQDGCFRCTSHHVRVDPNWLRAAGTPEGFNWLFDEFVDTSKHPDRDWSDWRSIFVDTAANVFNPRSYRSRLLESFDDKLADEKIRGKFVDVRHGRIYYRFDRASHADPDLDIEYDPSLRLHVSWDFNNDPLSTVIAQKHGNALWVIDQVVGTDFAKTEEVMRTIARRYPKHRAGWTIHGDASGRHKDTRTKGLTSDYTIIREVAREEGLHDFTVEVAPSNPSRRDRYNCVNGVLRNSKDEVRAYFHATRCRAVIKDLERQHFRPGTDEPAVRDDDGAPLGHSADALGYLCMDVFPLAHHQSGKVQIAVGY